LGISDRDKDRLENGKLLVILEGNHRYTSVENVINDQSLSEEQKKEVLIKAEYVIDYGIQTKEELNHAFLEINTVRNNVSNEDIIPYILQLGTKGVYSYDLAIYALTTTPYHSFNYRVAQYLCNGCDKLSYIYNNINRLKELAEIEKDKIVKDEMIISSESFEKSIYIPYVFETELFNNFSKKYEKLVYNGDKVFMKNLMSVFGNRNLVDRSSVTPEMNKLIKNNFLEVFYSFLSNCISNTSFLNTYIEIKGENLNTVNSVSAWKRRLDLIEDTFIEYIESLDSNNIENAIEYYKNLKNKFDTEVSSIVNAEYELRHSFENDSSQTASANYKNKHRTLLKDRKPSILAMYIFKINQ
jgi:hypothetical protein